MLYSNEKVRNYPKCKMSHEKRYTMLKNSLWSFSTKSHFVLTIVSTEPHFELF